MSPRHLKMRQALMCLYVQVPAEVAQDVTNRVMDAIGEMEQERAELVGALRSCISAMDWAKGNPGGLHRISDARKAYDTAVDDARAALEKAGLL